MLVHLSFDDNGNLTRSINMKPFLIQKISDEGTSEPFFARMMCQNLELRRFIAHSDESIKEFDALYEPIFNNLVECRQALRESVKLISDHSRKISTGEIISGQEKAWTITESVDKDLNRNFKVFFIKARISLQCLDKFSKFMDNSIGFFFQEEKEFQKGIQNFIADGKDQRRLNFIEMFKNDRAWYSLLREIRVKIEHEGFNLPPAKYIIDSQGRGQVLFPLINNETIEDTLNLMWGNIFEFSEDVFVSLIGFKLTFPAMISIIPESDRRSDMPIKYRVTSAINPPGILT